MQAKHVVFTAADIRFWNMVYWMSQTSVWPSSHATCLHITWLHPCITHLIQKMNVGYAFEIPW